MKAKPIIRAKSLKEKAYETLREMILMGELPQGKIQNEKKLAEALGVSRTPIREALLELSREGIVKFIPNKGIVIQELTTSQVKEVFEIRQIIECHIVLVVAKILTSSDKKILENILKKQETMARNKDNAGFIEADRNFHLFLSLKMKNEKLEAILQNLRDQIQLMGIYAISRALRIKNVLEEHKNIMSALIDGNGKRAKAEMEKHLRNTEKLLVEMIQAKKSES